LMIVEIDEPRAIVVEADLESERTTLSTWTVSDVLHQYRELVMEALAEEGVPPSPETRTESPTTEDLAAEPAPEPAAPEAPEVATVDPVPQPAAEPAAVLEEAPADSEEAPKTGSDPELPVTADATTALESEPEAEPAAEPEAEPATEPEPETASEPELTPEEQAEADAAARLASEREANKRARTEAAAAETRELERIAAAEREEQAALEQLEKEKKDRQARRAAKMKKRQEEASRKKEERVIAQYSLTKTAKGIGKKVKRRMSVVPGSTPLMSAQHHAPDLRVFRMTEKKMETLELMKGEMKPTGTYEFTDPTFSAKPVEGTSDQVVLSVTTAKGKAAEKVYVCADRTALLTDVAMACFKAKDSDPRRFPAQKYTRNNRMREVLLGIGGGSLLQLDPSNARVLSEYHLKDIRAVSFVNDDALPNGIVIQRKHRTHLFLCEHREQVRAPTQSSPRRQLVCISGLCWSG
jgi:hypothetical protein